MTLEVQPEWNREGWDKLVPDPVKWWVRKELGELREEMERAQKKEQEDGGK